VELQETISYFKVDANGHSSQPIAVFDSKRDSTAQSAGATPRPDNHAQDQGRTVTAIAEAPADDKPDQEFEEF
jgi:hypothetical protein